MERKKPNDARNLSESVSENSSEVELAELIEALGGHRAQLRVAVRKVWGGPALGNGYLGLVPVPPTGTDTLFQMITGKWGPGWYELRPYGRNAKGRMGYLPGSVTIELGDPSASATPNPAPGHAAAGPVIVQQPALNQELLRTLLEVRGGGQNTDLLMRALLERRDPSEAMISLLGQLARNNSGGGADLDQVLRVARFLDQRREQQPAAAESSGGISDDSMERMMLMSIFGRIMGPDQPAPPHVPRQAHPARAAPRGAPPPPASSRGAAPRQAPPRAAAPPPATPNPGEDPPPANDDDDDDELSLEEEITEHLEELSQDDPDNAVAWLLEQLNRLPPAVRERFQQLQAAQASEPNVVNLRRGGGS